MDRYDVIVQALDEGADPARAAEQLGLALGVDRRAALAVLDAIPATIREDVDEREAESLLHALREGGMRVRLKKRSASRIGMPRASARPGPASEPAPAIVGSASAHPASVRPASVRPPSMQASVQPASVHPRSTAPRAHGEIDLGEALPLPELPVPEPIAPAPRTPPRAAPAPAPIAVEPPVDEELTPPRFWGALPGALIFPFRGPGWKFLVTGLVLSPMVPIAFVVAGLVRFYALPVLYAAGAAWFGYVLAWFRACCFAAMTGGREPEEFPESSHWRDRFYEGGFIAGLLLGFGVLSFMVLANAARGHLDIGELGTHATALLVVAGIFFVYWPIGIGLLAARGSMLAFFDFAVAIKAFVQAPLELLAVLAVSLVAQGIAASVIFWVGVGAAMLSTWAWVLVLALAALPMAYVHAVMGTAMGLLFRVKPDTFA